MKRLNFYVKTEDCDIVTNALGNYAYYLTEKILNTEQDKAVIDEMYDELDRVYRLMDKLETYLIGQLKEKR